MREFSILFADGIHSLIAMLFTWDSGLGFSVGDIFLALILFGFVFYTFVVRANS